MHAQVAADALAVRHHAAEALLRLACARLAPSMVAGVKCLWAEIASGPTQIAEVIERLNTSAQEADPGERRLRALVEPMRLEQRFRIRQGDNFRLPSEGQSSRAVDRGHGRPGPDPSDRQMRHDQRFQRPPQPTAGDLGAGLSSLGVS